MTMGTYESNPEKYNNEEKSDIVLRCWTSCSPCPSLYSFSISRIWLMIEPIRTLGKQKHDINFFQNNLRIQHEQISTSLAHSARSSFSLQVTALSEISTCLSWTEATLTLISESFLAFILDRPGYSPNETGDHFPGSTLNGINACDSIKEDMINVDKIMLLILY